MTVPEVRICEKAPRGGIIAWANGLCPFCGRSVSEHKSLHASTAQGQMEAVAGEARGFASAVARALLAAPLLGRALRWLAT